ncbi:hypothetical protein B7R21_09845 [Subtercola boreus]|uniref:Uncharacterized protein n=1 Tax=Subtercola boreus TaxID=120213 RepID=A0A3E0VSZ4_9MICO|nr:hypothetical protein [Subtercola boreus]RFA12639.1 hypothetical protein B7R21_09845 [Subtercola boreus]
MGEGIIPAEGERARAKQREILAIDESYAEQWLNTMRALLARDLGDVDFTTARMEALKLWTRQRKLAQHNVHYRYNLQRRRPGLVEREIRTTLDLEVLRAKIERQRAKLHATHPELAPVVEQPAAAVETPATPAPSDALPQAAPVYRASAVDRGLLDLDDKTMRIIRQGVGNLDLRTATDEQLLQAFRSRGVPMSQALPFIAMLNARI